MLFLKITSKDDELWDLNPAKKTVLIIIWKFLTQKFKSCPYINHAPIINDMKCLGKYYFNNIL